MYAVCVGGDIVVNIADHVHYWLSCQDVQLQILAAKIMCNLSLIESQRIAVANTGILNSVIRTYSFCHLRILS